MLKSRISKNIIKQTIQAYKRFKRLLSHFHLRKIEIAVLVILAADLLFPQISLANQVIEPSYQVDTVMLAEVFLSNNDPTVEPAISFNKSLPLAENKEPKQILWVTVTAYSSTVDQTDDTPCVTANGLNICERGIEDIVAANFLSFGTKIKMPDEFGNKVFNVQDRMNKRYYHRVDIWMKSRLAAKEFGIKRLKVEVY